MKVADLHGPLLDYWVAKALGKEAVLGLWNDESGKPRQAYIVHQTGTEAFSPSGSWVDGGPILEAEKIAVYLNKCRDGSGDYNGWVAVAPGIHHGTGDTPLIAVCRALVTAKIGEEVPE